VEDRVLARDFAIAFANAKKAGSDAQDVIVHFSENTVRFQLKNAMKKRNGSSSGPCP
jgi:hypothetical protein